MLKHLADNQELLYLLEGERQLVNSKVNGVNLINIIDPGDLSSRLAIEITFYTQTQFLNEQPVLLLRFEPVITYSFGPSFTTNLIQNCNFIKVGQDYYFSSHPDNSLPEITQEDTNFILASSVEGYTFIVL